MYPSRVPNWIAGETVSGLGHVFEKKSPLDNTLLAVVESASEEQVRLAVATAVDAHASWARFSVEDRIACIQRATGYIQERAQEASAIVRAECGRPRKELLGEVGSAVASGTFFAGLANEFVPRALSSATPGREVSMRRVSAGVVALFTPFNTPLAQIAAKTFPALLCGDTVVLKAHELTPYIGVWFAHILRDAGVPPGVFNVVQGKGKDTGATLIADTRVSCISFTGSSSTGASIVKATADRLAKVSIEGGGKNPFVVCDDADIEKAARMAAASMTVDNGQRCAAATRLIVFDAVYVQFLDALVRILNHMNIGASEDADVGALISEEKLTAIQHALDEAEARGARRLYGGERLPGSGAFMRPALLECSPDDPIAQTELFGPVAVVFRVPTLEAAIALANASLYRLSAAIHTSRIESVEAFAAAHQSGVIRHNGPTFGSEPHMPFGGPGLSGNGWREPGVTALDFYANWQQSSIDT